MPVTTVSQTTATVFNDSFSNGDLDKEVKHLEIEGNRILAAVNSFSGNKVVHIGPEDKNNSKYFKT